MKKLYDNQGMTIMEVVLTVAVLAIALTILTSGIFAANNLMGQGDKVQLSMDKQASVLNGITDIDGVSLQNKKMIASFEIDGIQYKTGGTLLSVTDRDYPDLGLQSFTIKETEDMTAERKLLQEMKDMIEFEKNLTEAERYDIVKEFKKEGILDADSSINRFYANNDLFISYLYYYKYEQQWPQLLESNIPDVYTGSRPLYLHVFMASPLHEKNAYVYATTSPLKGTGSWGTTFLYDSGDGVDPNTSTGWYFRTKGNIYMTFFNNKTQAEWLDFRKNTLLAQQDGWIRVNP